MLENVRTKNEYVIFKPIHKYKNTFFKSRKEGGKKAPQKVWLMKTTK